MSKESQFLLTRFPAIQPGSCISSSIGSTRVLWSPADFTLSENFNECSKLFPFSTQVSELFVVQSRIGLHHLDYELFGCGWLPQIQLATRFRKLSMRCLGCEVSNDRQHDEVWIPVPPLCVFSKKIKSLVQVRKVTVWQYVVGKKTRRPRTSDCSRGPLSIFSISGTFSYTWKTSQ